MENEMQEESTCQLSSQWRFCEIMNVFFIWGVMDYITIYVIHAFDHICLSYISNSSIDIWYMLSQFAVCSLHVRCYFKLKETSFNICALLFCSINQMTLLTFGWIKLGLIIIHKRLIIITAFLFVVHLVMLGTNGVVWVKYWVEMSLLIAKWMSSSKVCFSFIYSCMIIVQNTYLTYVISNRECGKDYCLQAGTRWTKSHAI